MWLKTIGSAINSIFGTGAFVQALFPDGSESDISQIDPHHINGYTYNPEDGIWYQSPPEPVYGQYSWSNPADETTQNNLDFLRDLKLAWNEGGETFQNHTLLSLGSRRESESGIEGITISRLTGSAIVFSDGYVEILGDNGDYLLLSPLGDIEFEGHAGDNTFVGAEGSDRIYGGSGQDTLGKR